MPASRKLLTSQGSPDAPSSPFPQVLSRLLSCRLGAIMSPVLPTCNQRDPSALPVLSPISC